MGVGVGVNVAVGVGDGIAVAVGKDVAVDAGGAVDVTTAMFATGAGGLLHAVAATVNRTTANPRRVSFMVSSFLKMIRLASRRVSLILPAAPESDLSVT